MVSSEDLITVGIWAALVLWLLPVALLARKKGYSPWVWGLTGGPLAASALLVLPTVSRDCSEEVRDQRYRLADRIASILIVLNLLAILVTVAVVSD